MEYRIVHKDAFRIIGFRKRISLQFDGENPQIDELMERLTSSVRLELEALGTEEPHGILSISTAFEDRVREGSLLDQYVGVAAAADCSSSGFDLLDVPAYDWAVFSAAGRYPEALQQAWADIYAVWLPESGYDLAEGPEMLRNLDEDTSLPLFRSEIWIPGCRKRYEP